MYNRQECSHSSVFCHMCSGIEDMFLCSVHTMKLDAFFFSKNSNEGLKYTPNESNFQNVV